MSKIGVALCGATGMVGQRFIQLLEDHPWFELKVVMASERSLGKKYKDAVSWFISATPPERISEMEVKKCDPSSIKNEDVKIVFSALPSKVAGPVEEEFAKAGYAVASNAAAHRTDPDVPVMIPEVNAEHMNIINVQKKNRSWDGFIVTEPNCSTTGMVIPLKPIYQKFGISKIVVTTMQAISGAGYNGVPSMAIIDNVIPFIGGEEGKMETETLKLLGKFDGEKIQPADIKVSASCNRVFVLDGHLESVFLELKEKTDIEEIEKVLTEFKAEPQELNLPSAPKNPVIVLKEQDRPQPRFDRWAGESERAKGMAVTVGRIREDKVFENGIKMTVLSHNTIRGAAGESILNAELIVAQKWID
ncbi:MAG: aspartate-semialdehyde dehydrogenase [Candidatus Odinarchaeia archaeon]